MLPPIEDFSNSLPSTGGEHINLERFYRYGGEKAQLEAAP